MELVQNPYILAIVVYLLALIGVGYYKSRIVKTGDDFMVAGRALPWYILVGTLLATWIGNGSLFAGAGLGYRNGLAGLWSSAGAWLGIVVVYFIARRIRNFGQVTVPDIFEARYGKVAGLLATVTTVIAYVTIVSYQFRGGGRILSLVTEGGLTVETGIIITAVFAVLYTVLAGMLSVVYTDVVNGVVMIIGVLGALFFLVPTLGGLDVIVSAAEAAGKWELFGNWEQESLGPDGDPIASGPLIAISFFIPTMLLLMGDGNTYQRIFSAENGGQAQKAVFFWIVGVVVLETAISFLGLTGSVAYDQGVITSLGLEGRTATENIIPAAATQALPVVLGMLLVATMMAIVISTADSFLLVPATNLTRDVMQRYLTPNLAESTVVLVNRLWVIVLGLVAYMLVEAFPTILDAAYTAYLIYGAGLTPALVAAFVWKRATWQGALTSIVLGAMVTIIWTFYLSEQDFYATWHPFLQEVTFPAVAASLGGLVIVSLLTPKPADTVWAPFFIDEDVPEVEVEDLIEKRREGGEAVITPADAKE
ncbi:MAG: sodium:solute symporter family protein [Spiribacter salinus]|uniref:Sodium:solute symporter family protein n=1 Tax=Spiribacter salinus TaxID=1335746 RepID=A0A540VET4_9GAMM|nr:MAG: sodium:solute symporter family protein [Spiribacter salinus]